MNKLNLFRKCIFERKLKLIIKLFLLSELYFRVVNEMYNFNIAVESIPFEVLVFEQLCIEPHCIQRLK